MNEIMPMNVKIWGRINSVNVQKVLWCCVETGIAFTRIDAGMQFGQVDTPAYRDMNPNGRVPTLQDGAFVLWESHAIMRYLAMRSAQHRSDDESTLYPADPTPRASMERWLDWTLSTLQPAERPFFWGMIRTKPKDRDEAAIRKAAEATGQAWHIVETALAAGSPFIEGEHFTLADIVLGVYARRWFGIEHEARVETPKLRAWYSRICDRPGFMGHVAPPLS